MGIAFEPPLFFETEHDFILRTHTVPDTVEPHNDFPLARNRRTAVIARRCVLFADDYILPYIARRTDLSAVRTHKPEIQVAFFFRRPSVAYAQFLHIFGDFKINIKAFFTVFRCKFLFQTDGFCLHKKFTSRVWYNHTIFFIICQRNCCKCAKIMLYFLYI